MHLASLAYLALKSIEEGTFKDQIRGSKRTHGTNILCK